MLEVHYRTKIQFGAGVRRKLGGYLAARGLRHPLVVTDPGVKAAGLLDDILHDLPLSVDTPVYAETPSNPTLAAVHSTLQLYRDSGCDCVIGLGGGSSLDCAKSVALLSSHGGDILDYDVTNVAPAPITSPVVPVIAIPTTAGTGSEVGRGLGVATAAGRKIVVLSEYLQPVLAVCDPELTLTMPLPISAGTGLDALSHCLEACLSPVFNPVAGGLAKEGAGRLMRRLADVAEHPSDIAVRSEIMMGAILGGLSMVKGLGAAHAVAVPLDEIGLHHGTLVGVVMPHAIRFVAASAGERMTDLCASLGYRDANALADALTKLNATLGLPPDLRSMGVSDEDMRAAATVAATGHFNRTSARPAGESEYLSLMRDAW